MKEAPELVVKSPKAKVLTDIYATAYALKGNRNRVVPGSVLFENSLGGKILTVAFNSDEHFSLRAGMPRKNWMIYLFDKLDPEVAQGSILNDTPVMSIKRKAADNSTLLMVCNLGYDPIEALEIKLDKAEKIELLNEKGKWVSVDFKRVCPKTVVAEVALPCYGLAVLKIK